MSNSITSLFGFNLIDYNYKPWDALERANWRALDAALAGISSVPGYRGAWNNNIPYVASPTANTVIDVDSMLFYKCKVNHTSPVSGTFAAARAANPTYWELYDQTSLTAALLNYMKTADFNTAIANYYTKSEVDNKVGSSVRADKLFLAAQGATGLGRPLDLSNGFADSFKDQTGYDVANSVNVLWDSLNALVSNSGTSGPVGTGTAISSGDSLPASNAYDSDATETKWQSSGSGPGVWIGKDFGSGSAQNITSVSFRNDSGSTASHASQVIVEYSDDNISWTSCGSNSSVDQTANASTTISFASVGPHRYWRIRAAALSGNWILRNVSFSAAGTPSAMDLRFNNKAIRIAPSKASVLLFVKATAGTITVNTNFFVKLSRDAGVTYANAAVSKAPVAYSTYDVYEAYDVDLSAQGAASTFKVNITTVGAVLCVTIESVAVIWEA